MTEPATAPDTGHAVTVPPADHGLGHDLGIGDSLGPVEGFAHRLEHAIASHIPHHHAEDDIGRTIEDRMARAILQSQAPAQPETATTEGEQVPSLATDLRAIADRCDKLGEETVTKVEAIVASPAGATALTLVHQVTGLNIDPKIIEAALGGLQALLLAYPPEPAAAAQAPAETTA